ncbi:Wzz/FepE/Etk N-terminal domain-containing protein [Streptococcus suis]|uniref:Wzz/FepE/Etk N-terminal domain-containing protein n=1 Tax=Streptococcus suis TaxID=1307 RepID=UPI001ABE1AC5|nr:capsular biosynthesis protein CpsC [Streptococcus suis]
MKNQEENLLEIDVLYLLKTLWRKKFYIIIASVVTTVIAFIISAFLMTPQFDSTTRIYVVNQSVEGAQGLTNQELQAGTYLVKDYKEIIMSQDVLSQVEGELDLDDTLASKVSVSIPVDTRIVSITVRDSDPEEAARIANSLRAVAAQKIIEVTKVSDVTTLEEATPAKSPSSPNTTRNMALGFLVGTFLAASIILIMEVMDDRIKRPEDVEEKMGVPLIGVVPNISKLK